MALLPFDSAVTMLYYDFGAPSHNSDAFIQQAVACRGVGVPISNFFAGLAQAPALCCQGAKPQMVHCRPQNLRKVRHARRLPSIPSTAESTQHNMSAPASRALRRCVCTARPAMGARPAVGGAQQRIQRRWQSDAAAAPANPKIATIVDQISQLTLLETADLVSTLKVRRHT